MDLQDLFNQLFNHTCESHKSHCQYTGNYQGNWYTLHPVWHIGKLQLFADTCKYSQGKSKTDSCGCSEYHRLNEAVIFLYHKYRNTQNGAVGGNKGKKYAK